MNVLRRRWTTKPPLGARINWGHPLTRRLEFCALFNEGVAGPYDLARVRRQATPTNSPTWSQTTDGRAVSCPAGGTAFESWASADVGGDTPYIASTGLTLLWRGVIRTGSADRHFMGKHAGNGATDNPFDFRTDNSASPEFAVVRANAGGLKGWRTGSELSLNVLQEYIVTFANDLVETAPLIYVNGVSKGVASFLGTGTGAVTGSSSALQIGRRADGGVQLDGLISKVMIWSRPLLAHEVLQLYKEPWDMFAAPSPRIFVSAPAPADTVLMGAMSL